MEVVRNNRDCYAVESQNRNILKSLTSCCHLSNSDAEISGRVENSTIIGVLDHKWLAADPALAGGAV